MKSNKKRRLSVFLVGCMVSTAAPAQVGQHAKAEIATWRACADAAAARYAQSTESAVAVARLAILACVAEKRQAAQALAREDGDHIADEYVETIERRYIDQLSLNVMEIRLRKK